MRNLLALILLVLAPLVHALSLGDMRNNVRLLVRDRYMDFDEHGVQRFTDSTINGFLNEAQRQMQNDAWLYQGAFSMSLTSGTIEYALPADYVTTIRVTISSAAITQVSFQGLDRDSTNWTIATATPTAYFIDSFVSSAPARIGFYPNPKFTTTNSVFVQYVRQITTLVNDSDSPFGANSELLPYHDALVDFAAARCFLIMGRVDATVALMGMYKERAAAARANLNKNPNWQPGASGDRGPRQ